MPGFRLDRKIVVSTVVVTAMAVWYLLLPERTVGYVEVPKGYTKVSTGELASYNNRVLTGHEILELKNEYPEQIFLVKAGDDFVGIEEMDRVYDSEGGRNDFCVFESYAIIAIAKDGLVRGFAIRSS